MQRETPSPPSGILPVATDGDWLLVDGKSGYTLRRAPAERNTKHRQPPDDDQLVELYNLKEDIGQNPATQPT